MQNLVRMLAAVTVDGGTATMAMILVWRKQIKPPNKPR
jgi:hypothetical protein